jgi:hypothetical protein
MAHRMPLRQTRVLRGGLAGALLIAYEYAGSAPTVRWLTSQTLRSGSPSLHSVTRWRAKAYAMGPLVPSETVRRYPLDAGRCAATAATVHASGTVATTTRFARASPL